MSKNKTSGAATPEQLWPLHRGLASYFAALLKNATPEKPIRGSTLSEIRRFLKDNGIEASNAATMAGGLASLYGSGDLSYPFPAEKRPDDGT